MSDKRRLHNNITGGREFTQGIYRDLINNYEAWSHRAGPLIPVKYKLTDFEEFVLRGLSKGKSQKEIANEAKSGQSTVSKAYKNVKLKVEELKKWVNFEADCPVPYYIEEKLKRLYVKSEFKVLEIEEYNELMAELEELRSKVKENNNE